MILLTGATGYLGNRLLDKLISEGEKVLITRRETSEIKNLNAHCAELNIDREPLSKAFEDYPIRTVIHAAADYGRGLDLTNLFQANLNLPLTLLQLSKSFNIDRFVNISSSLPPEVNAYALSKHQVESWFKYFESDIEIINLRLEYFYGPGDASWKFISMLLKKMHEKQSHIELSNCDQVRDFIYIDDVVKSIYQVLQSTKGIRSFHVGFGQGIVLKNLVFMLAELMDFSVAQLKFGALPTRNHEVMQSIADTKAIEKIGWKPETTILEGLKKTINIQYG